jgi:hypothetical protein
MCSLFALVAIYAGPSAALPSHGTIPLSVPRANHPVRPTAGMRALQDWNPLALPSTVGRRNGDKRQLAVLWGVRILPLAPTSRPIIERPPRPEYCSERCD